ncbi:hypothetical protein SH611_02380 [Geminicoccaceae bacterium 1502E]|nr:hypothetical protein [Geminicoccaceae bacterium 1502E]
MSFLHKAALGAMLAALAVPLAADELPRMLRGSGEEQPAGLVLRGTPSTQAPAPPQGSHAAGMYLAAGERLWLLEPASGALVGCALERTANVGQRRIACAGRQLPAAMR